MFEKRLKVKNFVYEITTYIEFFERNGIFDEASDFSDSIISNVIAWTIQVKTICSIFNNYIHQRLINSIEVLETRTPNIVLAPDGPMLLSENTS